MAASEAPVAGRSTTARTALVLIACGIAVAALVAYTLGRGVGRSPSGDAGSAGSRSIPAEEDETQVPFPTAKSAGTRELFDLAPPKLAPVPQVRRPLETGLSWTEHDHCEDDGGGIVCGPQSRLGGRGSWWRVGRGPGLTLVNQMVGPVLRGSLLAEYDEAGRLGRLVRFDAYGEVQYVRSYDPAGRRYSARKPTGANALKGCGYIEIDGARPTRVTCLRWKLRPMRDAAGVAVSRLRRDANGLVVEQRRYGVGGQRVAGHDGFHRLVVTRDSSGRPVEERGYDLSGKPVASSVTGCHGHRMVRDRRGLLVQRRCLGTDGKSAPDRSEVALVRFEHDERGCLVAESYFDAGDHPGPNAEGVQTVRFGVNDRCSVVRRRCHSEGRVACGPNQPWEFRFKLDSSGRVVSACHFGVDGRPTGDPEYGVLELRYRYDARGNRVAQSCFGPGSREAVECHDTGFHRVESRYDHLGRKTQDSFHDASGSPTTNFGTFVRRFSYDAYDHLVETADFDDQGRAVESLGSASRRYLYDEGHRLFGLLQLDRRGEPAEFSGCITGHTCPRQPWHAVRVVRSAKGRAVRNVFFDRSRRLISRTDCDRAQCWD